LSTPPTQHRTLALLAACVLSACAAHRGAAVHADLGPASSPATATTVAAGQSLQPGRTLQVQSSLRIAPGKYVCPPVTGEDGAPGAAGVILIEGLSGVTLDLRGVTLLGAEPGTPRDALTGTGILLRRCDDVTVRGGRIGGYKACILALDCHDVVIEDVSFDAWYSDRLHSTVQAEDPLDWLWPHENDDGQWAARYGAAIALVDCSSPTVRRCRGRKGQNGILLVRSGGASIHDNDFSFLSGWGIALYRASKNVVDHNRFDYCVRGYSHGRYWRGQDSAGILVFERSSDNDFAYNSATHSADGLFLYGGQDLVQGRAWERGESTPGGCDRNDI
jgi:parallel beta-helix repeat protein